MQALARRAAAPIFALALFSSAGLIFVLQPLFARMVTPLLGGSPAVWNTSMAFFQAALLLGYLYAHLLARLKDLRIQAAIHIVVLIAAWFVLPVRVSEALGPPTSEQPALWLVGVLTLSVGAPFAAASATAPLLQSWYARTGRADAHDPYYLYAASNLGSFVGLIAYPALIEPLLGAQAQSAAWSAGYVFVAALIVLAGATAMSADGQVPTPTAETAPAPTWRDRIYWLGAAAAPGAMVLAVTQHISTDVASAPLLWVIPLALYLATFVIAFMRGGERIFDATLKVHPLALALMVVSYYAASNWVGSVSGILAGFFFSALICHQALARTRPAASRLTEFYLYVSLGGVLGGAFTAFAAPFLFNNIYEFPLAVAAACLFRPRAQSDVPRLADASAGAGGLALIAILILMRTPALEAALITGALGAAALMVAAGWGDEKKPAIYRYGFLLIGAVHALLVIGIAFNLHGVFLRSVLMSPGAGEAAAPELVVQQPWGALLLATSFLALTFAVHVTVQPKRDTGRIADFAVGAAIPSLVLLILLVLIRESLGSEQVVVVAIAFCGVAVFLNRGRPFVLAATVLAAFAIIFIDDARGGRILTQERTFFGVFRTREYRFSESLPPLRRLLHGTTLHGAQIADERFSRLPLTYYHPDTALGEAIVAGLRTDPNAHLALIGLGTGSTACLMTEDHQLTIYEIDPAVVRISARAGGDFTFVPLCQPNAQVLLGDARLRIAEAAPGSFDVIVVDAFSSDAIPAHLLTREAIAMYLSKLSDYGIVVLHLSNRHLALVSEAARVARDLNAPTLYRLSDPFPFLDFDGAEIYGASAASVMIVARSPEALSRLRLASAWSVVEAPPGRAWSDDYINLPRALWEGITGVERCWLYPALPDCGGVEETPAEAPVVAPPPARAAED